MLRQIETPKANNKIINIKIIIQRQMIQKGDSLTQENDPVRAADDVHVQKFKKHFQRK
jgi:hypothetical protein